MKWLRSIAYLLCAGPILAAGAPIIAPSTTTVYVKNTVQFTSTDTVTWSLRSGSTGTISAGGLYTAPNSFQAHNVMLGCPLLPNDHIYNTRIDTLPVDANSTTRINNLLGGTTAYISFEVSFPNNVISSATPMVPTTFYYTYAQNPASYPIVAWPFTGTENRIIDVELNQDTHILGVSSNTCNLYETYKYYAVGANVDCLTCNAQSGVKVDAMSYALPGPGDRDTGYGSSDAAGLYIAPLSLRYSELNGPGEINHALRFTLANGYNYSGMIWPARAYTDQCSNFTTCFPYGSRLRLKASFDETPFSAQGKKIIRALKRYGMFMADGGITLHIQAMADVTADTITWNTIFNDFGVAASTPRPNQFAFEQVDESSLMVSTITGHVNLANIYVVPDNFADVIATKVSDGSTASVRVAIQPVTAGFSNPSFQAHSGKGLAVMAGSPGFQIPYWIKGATTTTATCSMTSSTGTLTSGCFFTPPSTQVLMSTTVITLVPTADSTATIRFPLVVYPSDGIRYDVGGPSRFISSPVIPYDAAGNYGPDAHGSYWWADPPGTVERWYTNNDFGFPQSSWPVDAEEVGLFYTERHGNSDGAWSAIVPNGLYTLTIGVASQGSVAAVDYSIDTQSSLVVSSASVSSFVPFSGASYTPGRLYIPVVVTDNHFYFAIRVRQDSSLALLNMWSLTPGFIFSSKGLGGGCKLSGGAKLQ